MSTALDWYSLGASFNEPDDWFDSDPGVESRTIVPNPSFAERGSSITAGSVVEASQDVYWFTEIDSTIVAGEIVEAEQEVHGFAEVDSVVTAETFILAGSSEPKYASVDSSITAGALVVGRTNLPYDSLIEITVNLPRVHVTTYQQRKMIVVKQP